MKSIGTKSVSWESLRGAFESAAEALVSAIPLNLEPIEVSLSEGRSLSVRLTDSPMARAAIACNEWFSDDDEGEAGILRLWALLALLKEIPAHVLFEEDASVDSEDGPSIRDEVFMVASTMPLTRNGKLPRQKFISAVCKLVKARRDGAANAI